MEGWIQGSQWSGGVAGLAGSGGSCFVVSFFFGIQEMSVRNRCMTKHLLPRYLEVSDCTSCSFESRVLISVSAGAVGGTRCEHTRRGVLGEGGALQGCV